MIYAMLISAILTFTMLGIAQRVPDPYWRILLHAQEAPLAVFLFCSIALFMRTFEIVPQIRFRGKSVGMAPRGAGHWKPMISLLMGVSALAYRITASKAYVAWNNVSADSFSTWQHRGNVFALTLAVLAAVIGMAHLSDRIWARKLAAYAGSVMALLSLLPLLDPLGVSPVDPAAFGFVLLMAGLLYGISVLIQRRYGVL